MATVHACTYPKGKVGLISTLLEARLSKKLSSCFCNKPLNQVDQRAKVLCVNPTSSFTQVIVLCTGHAKAEALLTKALLQPTCPDKGLSPSVQNRPYWRSDIVSRYSCIFSLWQNGSIPCPRSVLPLALCRRYYASSRSQFHQTSCDLSKVIHDAISQASRLASALHCRLQGRKPKHRHALESAARHARLDDCTSHLTITTSVCATCMCAASTSHSTSLDMKIMCTMFTT